ncbi:MAG: penicillin-binding protein 2 [Cellvibrionaceae bacterium]|jgi:penicillin-binding protein 2
MKGHQHFKDHHNETRIFSYRVSITGAVICLLAMGLLWRYYSLQVLNHEDYATQSDNNRVLVQTISPQRGLIYDRNGKLLANNRPSYILSLIPENIDDLDSTIEQLRTLITIAESHLEDFRKTLNGNRRPFQPMPLRYRMTEEEIARVAVNEYHLQGVEIEAHLVREYPTEALFAHSVGYVGKINEREWNQFTEEEVQRYRGMHTIGKVGLEKYYEDKLFGKLGYRYVEINARMRVLRTLEKQNPVPGKNLQLHLDSRLQEAALTAMNGRRGAVVALDVKTGGILAILSSPSYDPNLFVTGISHHDYDALTSSKDVPLFDRSIQGGYPPASTIKPMLALAGLTEQIISRSHKIYDPGYYKLENDDRLYRDWKREGHGIVDIHKAIVQSSDTFFYDLAYRLGIDRIYQYGSLFGLGQKTGVDLPNERSGLWPSREWKRTTRKLPWFPGDTLNVGIGQGSALASPLQLAVMISTIANRGKYLQPRMVRTIGDELVKSPATNTIESSDSYWDYIFKAMYDVMHASNGTGRGSGYGSPYSMAGKTGTAQVVSIKQGERYDSKALQERHRDHGLFVGFAPFDDPQIAVAIIVENGESGSRSAAPIARKLFDTYLLDNYLSAKGKGN